MAQPAPIIPLTYKKKRLDRLTNGESPKVVVGSTHSSTLLDALGSLARVAIGATVTGAGIPAGTTVVDLDDVAHTAVMSQAATATAAGINLTFTNPAYPAPLKFRLGKVQRALDDAVTLGLLTPEECTLVDYPAGGYTLTFTPGYITGDRVPSNESQMIALIMLDASVTNLIWYWWVDDGTDVVMCAQFNTETGISMSRLGAALKLMLEDSYPPGLPISVILPAA